MVSSTYFKVAETRTAIVTLLLYYVLACVVAHRRCRKLGIGGVTRVLWLLQTLAFGIGSLKFLLWPVEDSPVQQQKKKKKQ
ncbi:hypothetical protein FJT64_000879 [Amphibalanus amphitrite]|uniref:Uncharacterized protein n=1 Tax=Amphibalanus amphitrite TaxID=1232801 RepID=A0A6A4VJR3_AMPAM|nr:hypothetical protein FJT64_000879 [Amphibalanus amphitrite]